MLEVSVALLEDGTNPTALAVRSHYYLIQIPANIYNNYSKLSKNYELKQPRKEIRSKE